MIEQKLKTKTLRYRAIRIIEELANRVVADDVAAHYAMDAIQRAMITAERKAMAAIKPIEREEDKS